MFSLTTLLIISSAAFIIGYLLSLLFTRTLSATEQKTRELEVQLQQAEQRLTDYQQEVTEHFAETAKRVNNLTQNYRDVHEHLAGSALKLANVDISRQLLSSKVDDAKHESQTDTSISNEGFEAPKDWAPSEGTLSEDYGLKEEKELTASNVHPIEK